MTHESNKKAWEEAFNNRQEDWGKDIILRCQNEQFPYIEPELVELLKKYDLKGKQIAQFCCNNGRELLGLMHTNAKRGVGFDIADNMVAFANETAHALNYNCLFIATDILAIDASHDQSYDAIFITIGALTWFEDLDQFFKVVSRCLKPGGYVFINEAHPLTNMLAMYGEDEYDPNHLNQVVHSYFKTEPWVESGGMDYFSDRKKPSQEVFYSYSHSMSSMINALINNRLTLQEFIEVDKDISGSWPELNNKGFPLSYLLIATKC
jgi:ubiquinone/menaquinone biosynthesis C-methylase UbiE